MTITPSSDNVTVISACHSYTWNGTTYNASGLYTGTTANCVTQKLDLTINNSTSSSESMTACGSYTWLVNGQTYSTTGTYTSTSTNAASCTHTNILNLTIGQSITTQPSSATICATAGSTTSFSVVSSGTSFIWQYRVVTSTAPNPTWITISSTNAGLVYTNYTSATLGVTRTSTLPAAGTQYRVLVSSGACISTFATSDTATLTVLALPTEVIGVITSNTETTTPGTYLAATTAVGQYVGTTTQVSYRVPAFADTTLSYYWTTPTGVNVVSQTANTLTVNFLNVPGGVGAVGSITVQAENANGCRTAAKSVALSKVLPTAPAAIKMTLGSSTTAITSFAPYIGTNTVLTLTATVSLTATSYVWELPTGVTQLSGGNTNVITVNFLGVTSSNTLTAVSTNVLRIGVKSRNGVGDSITNNAALLNPSTDSTAKLLTLTAVAPTAPASVTLTNPSSATPTTAITIISKYVGTNTPLTLTAAVSALASSYEWELPAGVNVVSGNASTDRVITVNFAGIPSGVTSYYIGAKAKNGIGYSVTNNSALIPSAGGSTAKLLKVTTSLPAAVATVTGQIVALCGDSTYSYTMTASALANSYVITAPTNAVVTSASNTGNTLNVLSTSDLTFSVTYPAGFVVGTTTLTANKSIVITSVNGVGNSATNKVLTLATALGAIGTNTNSYVNPSTLIANATLFGKCATQTITVPAVPFATSYVWTLQNGATGTSTTTLIVVNFSGVSPLITGTKNIIKVKALNACGVSSTEKSITLSWDGIMDCPVSKQATPEVTLLPTRAPFTVKAYPNPYTENFNLSLNTASEEYVGIVVYDMTGRLIERREVRATDIVEQQIGDHYPSGVYNVVVTQGEEVKTLRVIKR